MRRGALLLAFDVCGSERTAIETHCATVQDNWKAGKLRGMVATSASFAIGIDKNDVRCVVHIGLPASLSSYYQGIGRAGRDGLPAAAYLLFSNDDFNTWHRIKRNNSQQTWNVTATGLRNLLRFCHDVDICRHQALITAVQLQDSEQLTQHRCTVDSPSCDNCQRRRNGIHLVEITQHVQTCFSNFVHQINSNKVGTPT